VRLAADRNLTLKTQIGESTPRISKRTSCSIRQRRRAGRKHTGALNVDTGSGDVTIRTADGKMLVDTGSGDVEITDGRGRIDVTRVRATCGSCALA